MFSGLDNSIDIELIAAFRVKGNLEHNTLCKSFGDKLKALNDGDEMKTRVQANNAFMHNSCKLLERLICEANRY
ncbi:unnamed protein product [Rodentolepis nana]|uniref:DUF4371 domain-containing protein n=1 Tax=Rodentolepis nana TaxID=102285 RepID=A0A0R3TYR4_RODNA|nr:unnamed protein product [Rodentolepis nana]